jgi:hypothetical protein
MCRSSASGGRRCPSSRGGHRGGSAPAASGNLAGQLGDGLTAESMRQWREHGPVVHGVEDRTKAYREAGYKGPLNPDGRVPNPDVGQMAEVMDLCAGQDIWT